MTMKHIPDELAQYIREEAERLHYQLVDIAAKGGYTLLLEIILDKEVGITLDECSDFNRNITSWIEEHGVFDGGYTLDVCSPGLDRKLKNDSDFLWAQGKDICVTTYEPIDGKRKIVGKLLRLDGKGDIIIDERGGSTLHIGKEAIASARLYGTA